MNFEYPIIKMTEASTIELYLPDYDPNYTKFEIGAWLGSGKRVKLFKDEEGTDWFRLSKSHYRRLLKPMKAKYGMVYVQVIYKTFSKCDVRCVDALLDECVCSCFGLGHGTGDHSWLQVGATTLIDVEEISVNLLHHEEDTYVWLDGWVKADAESIKAMYDRQVGEILDV